MLSNLSATAAVLTSILTAILILFFMERMVGVFFVKRQTTLPIVLLTYAGAFIFLLLATFYVSPKINVYAALPYDSFLIFTSCYVITLNYKALTTRRFIVALSALPVFFSSNLFATIFSRFFYQANLVITETAIILVLLMSPLFAVIMATLLRNFKNIKKNMIITPMVTFFTLVMTMFAIYMIVIFMVFARQQLIIADSTRLFMLTVMSSTPLGFTILLFYIFDVTAAKHEDNIKSALTTQEKEYYYTQCRLMQESVENINSIHHDVKFHLAATRDFITTDKSDEAIKYLDGLLGDVNKSVIHSNTKNTAFDSIINYKLKNAGQENIKLNLRLLIPSSLNIEVADIVIILGNLLDNTLDAVSKVEEKFIKLDIEYSRESLFILVENTFDGVVKYAEEADNKGKQIITQKAGGEHGHGLKNIRKSVEKYNGHFEISHEGNIFSVTILLYVDAVKE